MAIGRPKDYTEEELIEKMEEYIKTLKYIDENGNERYDPFLKSGFNLFLGKGKEYLSEYKFDVISDFSRPNKELIDAVIENHNSKCNSRGYLPTAYGVFLMKNVSGWTDRIETKNENVNQNIIISEEEIKRIKNTRK